MADEAIVEVTYTADPSGRMRPDPNSSDSEEGLRNGKCEMCNDPEKVLDAVTGIVIFVNVVIMGFELDIPWDGYDYIEQAMLCVYVLDVILRMWWSGVKEYCTDRSHFVDVLIVLASVFEVWIIPATMEIEEAVQHSSKKRRRGSLLTNLTMTLRAFRLVRAFRLIKLVKFAKPLYMILQSMYAAFARVFWVITLIGVFLYAFSLVFTQLLGRDLMDALPDDDPLLAKLRHRFSTVPRTFFELFRAMCGDVTDFGVLVSNEDNVLVPLAYIAFQVSTPWLILAIFTAEVVDTTIRTTSNLEVEEVALKALHARTIVRNKLTRELYDLFAEAQVGTENQAIDLNTLANFLENPESLGKLADTTGLSAFQVINAWEAIEHQGEARMDDFIDGLVLASHQSQEHSILRMEAQVRRILKSQAVMLTALELPSPSAPSARMQDPACSPGLKLEEDGQMPMEQQGMIHTNGSNGCLPKPRGLPSISSLGTELSAMRQEIATEFEQLQRSVQAVHADQTGLRRGLSGNKEAVVEIRKMQREFSESNSQIHGAILNIGDVRSQMLDLCKQDTRSPQLDELRNEVHQLRNEVAQLPCMEEMGQLAQERSSGEADLKAGLTDVQDVIEALRADFASQNRSMRADRFSLGSVGGGGSGSSSAVGDSTHRLDPLSSLTSSRSMEQLASWRHDPMSRFERLASTAPLERIASLSPDPGRGRADLTQSLLPRSGGGSDSLLMARLRRERRNHFSSPGGR